MNESPLFSILVSNYNNSRFLQDCLESIFNQSYSNWEVIFVDDSSSDSSLEVLEMLGKGDERIRVFRNEYNRGCGFTKNRCVEEASGKLCGFLDPDDVLSRNAVIEMVRAHEKFPSASMVSSRHFICNRKLRVTGLSGKIRKKEFSNLLDMPWTVSHFASFKKAAYDRTEGISREMKRAVDQDLYMKLEEAGEIEFLDVPLYYYRMNRNSISLNENQYRAVGWHLYAVISACRRRNLDFDENCALLESGSIKKTFYDPLIALIQAVRNKRSLVLYRLQNLARRN